LKTLYILEGSRPRMMEISFSVQFNLQIKFNAVQIL
jgi:hypothetical protein